MTMIYFKAGDKVRLKQDIENIPDMIVDSVPKARMPRDTKEEEGKSVLLGVKCFWFTSNGFYQEKTFSTKDLKKIK
jgi:uncharacterized protein YodC (DUF2158 family)